MPGPHARWHGGLGWRWGRRSLWPGSRAAVGAGPGHLAPVMTRPRPRVSMCGVWRRGYSPKLCGLPGSGGRPTSWWSPPRSRRSWNRWRPASGTASSAARPSGGSRRASRSQLCTVRSRCSVKRPTPQRAPRRSWRLRWRAATCCACRSWPLRREPCCAGRPSRGPRWRKAQSCWRSCRTAPWSSRRTFRWPPPIASRSGSPRTSSWRAARRPPRPSNGACRTRAARTRALWSGSRPGPKPRATCWVASERRRSRSVPPVARPRFRIRRWSRTT